MSASPEPQEEPGRSGARPAGGPPAGAGGGADDRRTELLATVTAVDPVDDREAAAQARFLLEVDTLDHPFDEAADLRHVTASGIVTSSRGVVLHLHRRLHRWMQPGGHIDDGERPEEAAVRECREETGLDVRHPPDGPTVVHVDVHEAAKGHVHLDLRYLLLAPPDDPAPPPGESQDVAWFGWDDAMDLADEALTGGLVAARRIVGGEAEGPPGTDAAPGS